MASVLGHIGAVALERRHIRAEMLLVWPIWSERRMLLSLVLWRLETFDVWSLMLRSMKLRLLNIGSSWSSRSLVIAEVSNIWSPELWSLVSILLRSSSLRLLDIIFLWSLISLVIVEVLELTHPELRSLVPV